MSLDENSSDPHSKSTPPIRQPPVTEYILPNPSLVLLSLLILHLYRQDKVGEYLKASILQAVMLFFMTKDENAEKEGMCATDGVRN
uniref:AlNc14C86G5506 protein n=1 Tax=Albugo laibachii Nc14 TaxID=890382 RepID=F0WFX1_9STRA|nr:AlNc14C86G5506 [Albugo laibachii Nc14]|eukprot:CCA20105.1 AlNc14C86G5506 [Albugo laibachii Nc14]